MLIARQKWVWQPVQLGCPTKRPPPDWIDCMKIGEPGEQTLPAFGLLDFGRQK